MDDASPRRGSVSGAAMWSYLSAFADRGLRFVLFVMLARLLSPAELGFVALAALLTDAIQALLESGYGNALVRKADVSASEFDTAFWSTMALSGMLSLVAAGLAYPVAGLLARPDLALVMLWLAPIPLLVGLGKIPKAHATRQLGFRALAGRTVGSTLVGGLVGVFMAAAGFGIWAIVVRNITVAALQVVVIWLAVPWRPAWRFSPVDFAELTPVSLRLMGAEALHQVNLKCVELMSGAGLGAAALGLLRVAAQTLALLVELSAGPLAFVGYAVLGRTREGSDDRQQAFFTIARLAALLIFPVFLGLMVVADDLLPLMFGARWQGGGVLMQILCLMVVPIYWQIMFGMAVAVTGRAEQVLLWSVVEIGVTIAALAIGIRFGLIGVTVALLLRYYAVMFLQFARFGRRTGLSLKRLIRNACPSMLAACVMAVAVAIVKAGLPLTWPPVAVLAVAVTTGCLVYAVMLPLTAAGLRPSLQALR